MRALLVACFAVGVFPGWAAAEQASQPGSLEAGRLDAGTNHTCALLADADVRCWGFNGDGQLGNGNTQTIGDDETPASLSPVNLGAGRTAMAICAGGYHTCALLDDGSVRCWGFGADGRLGYGNASNVESPDSTGLVDLGQGRTAKAISAGGAHTCAILDNGSVRCWGFGGTGQLGYGTKDTIGDNETPGTVGPVNLGLGRTATAISAGGAHTCAVLDDGSVRCWGNNSHGELGYGNTANVGDTQTPDTAGPVNLGLGRTATAISAGGAHTCAVLDDHTVRCWGYGATGQLGYANTDNIGDNETPGTIGPVNLGPGRTALAVSAGQSHTCARLDDHTVRCWGYGANGQLGYCNPENIGDDEPPASAGPVNLETGDDRGIACKTPTNPPNTTAATTSGTTAAQNTRRASGVGSDAARARSLHSCLAAVATRARRERKLAQRDSQRHRARVLRDLARHTSSGRRRCLRRYGRTPGHISGLRARTLGSTQIEVDFNAAGSDGAHPPPAHSYVVKQSRRPIRSDRDFARAQTLCNGACRFTVSNVGGKIMLTVTDLRAHATYYYAVAARDNVSAHRGPRSPTVKAKTR